MQVQQSMCSTSLKSFLASSSTTAVLAVVVVAAAELAVTRAAAQAMSLVALEVRGEMAEAFCSSSATSSPTTEPFD